MGAELEKGRNLLAETSGGQIRKGPKPLATVEGGMDQQVPNRGVSRGWDVDPSHPRLIFFYLDLKIGAWLFFSHLLPFVYVWKGRLTYFGTNLLRKLLRYKI